MVTPLFRAFHSGPRCRATRPLWWKGHGAGRGLASSGALAGLVALAGSAGLPVPAAGQDPFACGADQIEVPFELTETVKMWDVPEGVESLRVIAAGGRGGAPVGQVGAAGALVAGTFPVTPDQTLHIIVAGRGSTGAENLSGGGGTFVGVDGFSYDDGELLLVAGGGGGYAHAEAPGGNAGLPGNDGDHGDGVGGGHGGGDNGEGGGGGCIDLGVLCGGGGGGASAGSHGANGDNGGGGGGGAGGNGGRPVDDPSLASARAAINGGDGGEGLGAGNDGGFGGGGGGGDVMAPGGGGGGGFAGGGGGSGAGGGGGSSFVGETGTDTSADPYVGGDGFVRLCYEAPPPPSFSKSFSPASIAPGETSTLTFTIDNSESAADAEELAFTDTLPEGLMVAGASNHCGGELTLTLPPGEPTIEYANGTVAAEASCTVSVDVTSTTPGTHENTTSELTSSAGTSDPAQATLEVGEVMADLSIALEAAEIGNPTAELAVTAGNAGPDDATGVGVTLELPACTQVDSDSCDGTFADGEWTWEIGALAADDSAACTVTVEIVDCEEPPTIGATIEGDQGDPEPANNTAELTLEIEPVPALPTLALVLLAAALTFVTLRKLRRTHTPG